MEYLGLDLSRNKWQCNPALGTEVEYVIHIVHKRTSW